MKISLNLTKVLSIGFFTLAFSTISFAQGPPPGSWDGSTISTTTMTNSVGIGTNVPQGQEEIKYCKDQENGLVITKYDCGLDIDGPLPTYDGVLQPNVGGGEGGTTTVFNVPLNFNLTAYNTFQARPLLWTRVENSILMKPGASGGFTTRFVVTPYGKSGLNIENPRATLDIKSLGTYNMPAVIIGRQVIGTTNKTQHLHFVPLLNDNGYNQISVKYDQGMFFTDGMGTDGANINGAFVIAPWSNNRDPLVGGMRMDKFGNTEFHGTLRATKIKVEAAWWSDFVFAKDYKLRPLNEVELFIKTNGHLPEMPNETEVLEKGIDVSEMQAKQQQKIEELTLYLIEQQKLIKELQLQVENLKKK